MRIEPFFLNLNISTLGFEENFFHKSPIFGLAMAEENIEMFHFDEYDTIGYVCTG
jgi:hypothetical protein